MPLPILAIAALANAGVQLGTGIYQGIRASQIDASRPKYNIPDEIKQNLTQAEINALEGLPEEQRQMAVDRITRSLAQGVTALGDRRAGIAGISSLVRQGIDASRDLASMDAQQRLMNEQVAMQQRGIMANYKDKAWDWNERQRFEENARAKQALAGAAMQNVTGAFKQGFGGLVQSDYMQMMQKLYGGGGADGGGIMAPLAEQMYSKQYAPQQQSMYSPMIQPLFNNPNPAYPTVYPNGFAPPAYFEQ